MAFLVKTQGQTGKRKAGITAREAETKVAPPGQNHTHHLSCSYAGMGTSALKVTNHLKKKLFSSTVDPMPH